MFPSFNVLYHKVPIICKSVYDAVTYRTLGADIVLRHRSVGNNAMAVGRGKPFEIAAVYSVCKAAGHVGTTFVIARFLT